MTDRKLYLYCCLAGAYTAAFVIALYEPAAEKIGTLFTDPSLGAVLSLLGLPIDALVAGFSAIPKAALGLLAGIPGMAGGYIAVRKLRAAQITALPPWLGAGACVGAANAAIILLLIPEREAGQVMSCLMTGGVMTAFYIWRAGREAGYYNR